MADYIVKDKTIIFSSYFNKEIESGLLVQYYNVIFSDYELNEELFECYKNNDLDGFEFVRSRFDQQVNFSHNLTHLTFGLYFNQQVNLPPNLTHLTFGYYFNQQVNLPEKITHLRFGDWFNQQVNLSHNLTHLTFGYDFNQQVNLPENLTHLIFGNLFNQQVNLPEKLTHLTFGSRFNQQVNLPLNVRYLNINCNNVNIIDYLPDSVEELVLNWNFNLKLNNLSSSVKKLVIINQSYNHELNCLPNNLEYLGLPVRYDKEIQKYPKQLKKIKCSKYYKYIDKINDFQIETYD